MNFEKAVDNIPLINDLRGQQIIVKDLEIERKFEQATQYLFEKKLRRKPLTLIGEDSRLMAMQFQVEHGTTITLMRSADLKALAEDWDNRGTDDPFPLGYLIQPGLFNRSLVGI